MRTSRSMIAAVRTSVPLIIVVGALTITTVRAADVEEEVTVTAPAERTIGRSTIGAPITEVSVSEKVQYNSSMLMTNSGRALLQDKIATEARRLCQEAETPGSVPAEHQKACEKRAIQDANEQIAAAAAKVKAG